MAERRKRTPPWKHIYKLRVEAGPTATIGMAYECIRDRLIAAGEDLGQEPSS